MAKAAKQKAQASKQKQKKRQKQSIIEGRVHVHATFNNTIVTITDLQGNTLTRKTAGELGYKGARKSTPLAAQRAAVQAAQEAKNLHGLQRVEVIFKGPGPCREYVVKALRGQEVNLDINALTDRTPIPHNGCRPRKKRRV